jgi:hypothetical protein
MKKNEIYWLHSLLYVTLPVKVTAGSVKEQVLRTEPKETEPQADSPLTTPVLSRFLTLDLFKQRDASAGGRHRHRHRHRLRQRR